jgi:hypothetical protein
MLEHSGLVGCSSQSTYTYLQLSTPESQRPLFLCVCAHARARMCVWKREHHFMHLALTIEWVYAMLLGLACNLSFLAVAIMEY